VAGEARKEDREGQRQGERGHEGHLDARQGLIRFLLAFLTALVPVAAAAATVTGAVRVSGPRAPGAPTAVTIDAAVCGDHVADESLLVDAHGGVQNAVVTLRPAAPMPAASVPPGEVRIDNAGCRFVPRVQLVRRGQTVRVGNADPVLHNTRADLVGPPEVAVANLALPRAGATMDLTRRLGARLPEGPGEAMVRLGCDVHPWMRGWLVVVDSPYVAVTDAAGSYAIRDVPPGAYTLSVWHEVLGRHQRQVTVPATDRLTLDEKL
jgi:hypothetical protein